MYIIIYVIYYTLSFNILQALNFRVKLPEDGVYEAETCRSNTGLYFYVSNVHSLVLCYK